MSARIFTRDEILEALALHPCHVTGMHQPEHHPRYTCPLQLVEALKSLLTLLDASIDELPRALHDAESCGWCHRVPQREKDRQERRESYRWAGVEIPEELLETGS